MGMIRLHSAYDVRMQLLNWWIIQRQ